MNPIDCWNIVDWFWLLTGVDFRQQLQTGSPGEASSSWCSPSHRNAASSICAAGPARGLSRSCNKKVRLRSGRRARASDGRGGGKRWPCRPGIHVAPAQGHGASRDRRCPGATHRIAAQRGWPCHCRCHPRVRSSAQAQAASCHSRRGFWCGTRGAAGESESPTAGSTAKSGILDVHLPRCLSPHENCRPRLARPARRIIHRRPTAPCQRSAGAGTGHGAATRSHELEGACRSGGRTQETRVPCGLSGEPLPEGCARSETGRGAQGACARASGAPTRARRKAPPGRRFGAGFGGAKPHPHHRRSATAHQGAHRTTGFENHPRGHRSQPSHPCGAGCSAACSGTGGRGAARRTSEGRSGAIRHPAAKLRGEAINGQGSAIAAQAQALPASRVASSTRPRPSVLAR